MACSVFHRSPLAIVVFRIRRGLLETQSFKNAQAETDQPKSGMFALFKHYPKEAFTVLFLTAGGTLAFILTPPIYRNI